MSGFETLSTEALHNQAERQKVVAEAEKMAKVNKPRFDPKVIAEGHKHAARIAEAAQKKKSQPAIITKIVKLEKYYGTFGHVLKSKKPKINAETVTERELDVHIETVEKELNSRNSDRITQTVWLLGVKGVETLADLFVGKEDLDLSSKVKLSDVASSTQWLEKVSENLAHLQIKYSLFETSPEVSLLLTTVQMVREVNAINKGLNGERKPEEPENQGRYEKL